MECRETILKRTQAKSLMAPVAISLLASALLAETPKLSIKTAHGDAQEQQRMQQMERLAKQYDLKTYTITREIVIDRGAINHSSPVLTLNLRFLDNDDLALSAYVHEQGHWVLMERHRADNPALFDDLHRAFPTLECRRPSGDGELRSSYFHIAICMLEWQAMEELVGPDRARKVIELKQRDHYTDIYALVLSHRERVESILNSHGVKW